jgi:RimJ/RimL family protein N-acetyltransferase
MEPKFLEALLNGNTKLAESIGGFVIPKDLNLRKGLLKMRLGQIQNNPKENIWLTRAIVIKESNTMCGHVGFHSEPGPEDLKNVAVDGVEMGYSILERFRRQGFAKEAALELINWAFVSHQQRCFILSIAPSNVASLAMANSMGFREIGSHIDEEDGLELYFELRL